jgi:hypothetical protein
MCDHALRWALQQRAPDADAAAVLHAIALQCKAGSAPASVLAIRDLTALSRPAVLSALRSLEGASLIAATADSFALVGYLAETPKAPRARKPKASTGMVTLQTWRDRIRAAGESLLPENDPIFDYADEIGLTLDMIHAQWHVFVQAYVEDRPTKLYTDWRATFRASVRGNWFKLWFIDGANGPKWTSVGQQALASLVARRNFSHRSAAHQNTGGAAG